MTQVLTRDEVIRSIIIERAALLTPQQILRLVDELPAGVLEAIEDFGATVELSPAERSLLLKHNISIPWELMQYAQVKEAEPNIKVEWPPRNK